MQLSFLKVIPFVLLNAQHFHLLVGYMMIEIQRFEPVAHTIHSKIVIEQPLCLIDQRKPEMKMLPQPLVRASVQMLLDFFMLDVKPLIRATSIFASFNKSSILPDKLSSLPPEGACPSPA